jgi:hypothetical protein
MQEEDQRFAGRLVFWAQKLRSLYFVKELSTIFYRANPKM